MTYKVLAVYDGKAEAFLQPFFSDTPGSAVRAFGDEVMKPESPFHKHPGDYQLYELGTFDNLTGKLTAMEPMKLHCNGIDFVAPIQPQEVINAKTPSKK